VVTTYITAVVLDNGEVHFYDDIHGEAAALEEELIASGALESRESRLAAPAIATGAE
jgi:hypothetical protein